MTKPTSDVDKSAVRAELVAIRDRLDGDESFIMATWLKGLRFGNHLFRLIEPKAYFSNYAKVIIAIINKPETSVKVACLRDEPSVILAYSVSRGDCLDWVFCKRAWRGLGIAKSLVNPSVASVSHLTETGKSIIKTRPNIVYNPFII